MTLVLWIGILLCLSQSAMLSGLNLAFFTILSSTVIITIFGEIFPQVYFSRNALKFGSLFSPVLRFYQKLLFPVAEPTAMVLDRCLGPEAISYFKEKDIRQLIQLHMAASESDIEKIEGQGALNFLDLDDVPLAAESEPIDLESIIDLPFQHGKSVFPAITGDTSDPFLRHLHQCGKKWIVLVDSDNAPKMVLNADEFIRDALFNRERFNPYRHCTGLSSSQAAGRPSAM